MTLSSFDRDPGSGDRDYLRLEKVSRQFGDTRALDDVSLSIRHGEILCLAGQSGCGKSTLLRLISGIDRPDSGRIWLDGSQIAGPDLHREPEDRNIGFMFQDYALFPHLDVTGNILFGLKKLPRTEARLRCMAIIERLRLVDLAGRYPHMLSGGEQQRVALARALAPQPHILLMDEPFSNLDRRLHDEVRQNTLELLRELEITAIIVTHDPEEALSAGDHVALMRQGRIVQSGTGPDLYDRPQSAYAAEFFCTFNKIEGACHGGFLDTPLGRFEAPAFSDGARAAAYLRPQNLRIAVNGAGIPGRIVSHVLMGEIEQVGIVVEALASPLLLRSTERRNLQPGQEIRLDIRHEEALIF